MRLTLRTMLAYLDDILEPDDAEDIGKKIEESEFATNLMHRTRDCMRRLRLGVPPVIGKGLGADPNSVAEYLDNTLAAERVGEFEKVCLESDVHLSEVASCHQILTLVLGEPAEIDPDSRQRVYRLAGELNAPPVQSDAIRPSAVGAASAGAAGRVRIKPEVPEYLRDSRSQLWPLAAMVLVAALLTFGGLMFFGPAELRERAIGLVRGPQQDAEQATAETPSAAGQPAPPAVQSAQGTTLAPDASATPGEEPASREIPPAADSAALAADEAGAGNDDQPPPSIAGDEPAEAAKAEEMTEEPDAVGATETDATGAADLAGTDAAPATQASPPAAETPAKAEAPSENLGRFISKRDVLLKYDQADTSWKRLPSMSPLSKGERIMSLPLFRPTISLSSNVTIQAEGPSLMDLVGWNDQGAPVIEIEFGRLLMATVGKANNALELKSGDQQFQIIFADADAQLALEVRRTQPPGKDPEEAPAPPTIDLYITSGLVRVREGEKLIDLQAPIARTLFAPASQQPSAADFPKWVNSEAPSGSEREATTALEPALVADQPASLVLKQLTDSQTSIGRRREVRALATRSLVYLGDYEPCIAALNDPKEKLSWPAYMEELRAAVSRSPETAAQIRATFEKQRGTDAPFLYRMLWGYSLADLKNGADKDLVDALDKDSLDYRVMGFWNLQNITGSAHHGYRPEDMANKRRTPYNAWKEKLRQKKIVPQGSSTTSKSKSAASKGG